nr:elongation factor 2-like [Tanacetum cinerariifolium]
MVAERYAVLRNDLYAFSCEVQALTRHIFLVGYDSTLSRSSSEAEYRGVVNVVSETCWLRNLLLLLELFFGGFTFGGMKIGEENHGNWNYEEVIDVDIIPDEEVIDVDMIPDEDVIDVDMISDEERHAAKLKCPAPLRVPISSSNTTTPSCPAAKCGSTHFVINPVRSYKKPGSYALFDRTGAKTEPDHFGPVSGLAPSSVTVRFTNVFRSTLADAHPISAMKFSISPVVRVAVQCDKPDICKLLEGVSFDVCHAVLHPKASFRGPTQIVPTTKRAIYAAQLTAKPRLLEPVYLVEIHLKAILLGSAVSQRRGHVFKEMQRVGTSLYKIKAYLPVAESFGFSSALWDSTNGEACPHWDMMSSDPLDAGSKAGALVATIRKMKGLKEQLPQLSDFV